MKNNFEPKANCVRVVDGKVRSSDFVWDIQSNDWRHPNSQDRAMLGTDVKSYYAVCRKIE